MVSTFYLQGNEWFKHVEDRAHHILQANPANDASESTPSLYAVPARKRSESKAFCSFLRFVYNTAIRSSDALHMGGISRDLQQQDKTNTRYKHKCSSVMDSIRKRKHAHTTQQSQPACACCLLVWRGSVLSTVPRQALKNRQVSTRCGAAKHFLVIFDCVSNERMFLHL